jgi:hypothetical protein
MHPHPVCSTVTPPYLCKRHLPSWAWALTLLMASTAAPAASSCPTTPRSPSLAAQCRGVLPSCGGSGAGGGSRSGCRASQEQHHAPTTGKRSNTSNSANTIKRISERFAVTLGSTVLSFSNTRCLYLLSILAVYTCCTVFYMVLKFFNVRHEALDSATNV